jgi:hypothetical protein
MNGRCCGAPALRFACQVAAKLVQITLHIISCLYKMIQRRTCCEQRKQNTDAHLVEAHHKVPANVTACNSLLNCGGGGAACILSVN